MSPVTRNVYDHIRKSLVTAISKNPDSLLTKKIPFNCIVAKEIGIKLDPKVVSSLERIPLGHDVHTVLPLLDCVNAMEEYGKKRWGLEGFEDPEDDQEISELPKLEELEEAPKPEGDENE